MNKANAALLHKLIVQSGNEIHNKLPPHPAHPHGRIGIAHIYSVIKAVMGVPLKDVRDSRFDDVVYIVKYCVDNVHVLEGLTAPLKQRFAKEPIEVPATLEKFL